MATIFTDRHYPETGIHHFSVISSLRTPQELALELSGFVKEGEINRKLDAQKNEIFEIQSAGKTLARIQAYAGCLTTIRITDTTHQSYQPLLKNIRRIYQPLKSHTTRLTVKGEYQPKQQDPFERVPQIDLVAKTNLNELLPPAILEQLAKTLAKKGAHVRILDYQRPLQMYEKIARMFHHVRKYPHSQNPFIANLLYDPDLASQGGFSTEILPIEHALRPENEKILVADIHGYNIPNFNLQFQLKDLLDLIRTRKYIALLDGENYEKEMPQPPRPAFLYHRANEPANHTYVEVISPGKQLPYHQQNRLAGEAQYGITDLAAVSQEYKDALCEHLSEMLLARYKETRQAK